MLLEKNIYSCNGKSLNLFIQIISPDKQYSIVLSSVVSVFYISKWFPFLLVQDMYDLLLDYGCYCTCCSQIKVDVKNARGLTPLALAAKLANKEVIYLLI